MLQRLRSLQGGTNKQTKASVALHIRHISAISLLHHHLEVRNVAITHREPTQPSVLFKQYWLVMQDILKEFFALFFHTHT